ncbi:peroxisome biogenesis factor 10-like [Sitodiplosis mosellana]|uniref:peroxisome biogenesis factor 10-like n=1 Tax=Sitodiplosis mosellana TaxID=263140 RepID=UPI002443F00D|nr:peroxisome biogenesis factor 10-like [Sitodiplosis mosellana]
MKSVITGIRDIEKTQNTQLQPPSCFNWYSIISWDELFKPERGFVVHNSIAFEVKIKVDKVEEATSTANKRRAPSPAEAESMECSICFERMKGQDVSSTDCGHLFCSKCIKNAVRSRGLCPSCNTKLNLRKVRRVYLPFAKND